MEAVNEGFKIPSIIPQDLLLIQDLIGPIIPPARPTPPVDADDCVDSSGESADEVEANIISLGEKSERSVSYCLKFPFVSTNSLLEKTSLTLSQTRPLPTQTLLQTLTLTV
jgi:hypothetical protein